MDERAEIRILRNRQRRRCQTKRNFTMLICSVILIFTIGICCGNMIVNATFHESPQKFKYFTCLTVYQGDTLDAYAEKYVEEHYSSKEQYVREVMRINSLESDEIVAGNTIIVPYWDTVQ